MDDMRTHFDLFIYKAFKSPDTKSEMRRRRAVIRLPQVRVYRVSSIIDMEWFTMDVYIG